MVEVKSGLPEISLAKEVGEGIINIEEYNLCYLFQLISALATHIAHVKHVARSSSPC